MPSMRLVLALAAASLLAACGATVAAGLGESCGPSHGCAAGLTCENGTCTSLGGNDGGTVSDGGNGGDGGTVTDGGTTGDGGTVADGGTTDGGTTDGGSACGPCDTPPDVCHGTQGTCQNGACVYPTVDGVSCDDGNPCTVQDTCSGGTCAGTPMVCNTPPGPACISGTQLSTYDQTGVCQQGRCTYTKKTITCGSGGCVNNACQTDPCATMTCNTPPSICYTSAGTCSNGSCSYPYADGTTCNDNDPCTTGDTCNTGVCKGQPIVCNNPPPSTCTGANTAKIYAPAGVCSAGNCSYTFSYVTCASGCSGGACKASGWTTMVSNTNYSLNAVWGSSANDVWAGGSNGALVHWNGAVWKVQSPTSATILRIHGTSATDVYALAQVSGTTLQLFHYDGTSWSSVLTTTAFDASAYGGLYVLSPGHVLLAGFTQCCYSDPLLEEFNGTTESVLATSTLYPNSNGTGLWAFSSTNVYWGAGVLLHYDGTGLSTVTTPAATAYDLWASGPSDIFVIDGGDVEHYDGTTWSVLATGHSGSLAGISGTASNRVFAAGYSGSSYTTSTGYVEAWDGTGWVQEVLPASTPGLAAIWAAPNGEVFAVGYGGTIVHGP